MGKSSDASGAAAAAAAAKLIKKGSDPNATQEQRDRAELAANLLQARRNSNS